MGLAGFADSIPYVLSDADRTARFPAPPKNFRVQYPDGTFKKYVGGGVWQAFGSIAESLSKLSSNFLVGNGITDDRAALDTLVNVTMQPDGGELDIVGIVRIGSNLTIPANVDLVVHPDSYLAPDVGVILTVESAQIEGMPQVFGPNGSVIFGAVSRIKPEWFGATNNGATNDAVAVKRAIQLSADGQTSAEFGRGIRQITAAMLVQGVYYASLKGEGFSYLRWGGPVASSMLKLVGPTAADGMRRVFIDGLWFILNDASSTALEIGNPDDHNYGTLISRVTFQGPNAQGVLGNSEWDEVLWLANYFVACGKGVYLKKSPVVIPNSNHAFISNFFQNCTDFGVDSERSALLNFIFNVHQTEGPKGVRVDRNGALVYLGNYHEHHPADSIGLSVNALNPDPAGGGGGGIVGGNVFNINNGGASVGLIIGAVGKGFRVLPNQFFTAKTGIRILASAPQELSIDPQNFKDVTTEIDDQRVNPSRAFNFNIGAKMAVESTDPFVQTIANGGLMRQVYAVRIPKESWRQAVLVQQVRIGTTPPRARIVGCFCDTIVAFAGLGGTIQLSVGSAAGSPADMILAHDVKTGLVTKGLVDADLGALLARATAVQGGGGAWAGGNDLYAQLSSSVGNLGTGIVTNLTAGEVKIYVVVEVMP